MTLMLFVVIPYTAMTSLCNAKPLGRNRSERPISSPIRHRAARSHQFVGTTHVVKVEEAWKNEKDVTDTATSSTNPDTLPSSFSTTHTSVEITVMPEAEQESSTKVHKSRSGRSADRVRTVYPKMCYFSPIQCMFATT